VYLRDKVINNSTQIAVKKQNVSSQKKGTPNCCCLLFLFFLNLFPELVPFSAIMCKLDQLKCCLLKF
jgi:hypothetical protein